MYLIIIRHATGLNDLKFHTYVAMITLTLCLNLFLLYLQLGDAFSYGMTKDSFTYSMNDTLENITASSVLQCARRCSYVQDCVAVEMQEENSKCVILKNVTKVAEMTTKQQYSMNCECDDGWVRFSRSCYIQIADKHYWSECERICNDYDGHIMTITSAMESDFITSIRDGQSAWIGAKTTLDEKGNVTWIWANGDKWEYTNWEIDQPDEDSTLNICARFFGAITEWRDRVCDYGLFCFCEKMLTKT